MYQSKTTRRTVCTYNHDYTKEFVDVEAGVIPRHRLLLLADHFGPNHHIHYITGSPFVRRFLNWKLMQAIIITCFQSRFDEVFCTTESSAWFVLLFKAVGLLRLPVTVVNVALLRPAYRSWHVRCILRLLLRHATVIVSYASFQLPLVASCFRVSHSRQRFVKFQVDRDFILAHKTHSRGMFILSVGTNEGRDYESLLASVDSSMSLIICTDYHNKEIIVRSRNYNSNQHMVLTDVPYLDLLELYSRCKVFVSCLHDVDYSSGQTVIQEAMLLCENVLVSNVKVIQDYVESSGNVYLVPLDSPQMYRALIKELS